MNNNLVAMVYGHLYLDGTTPPEKMGFVARRILARVGDELACTDLTQMERDIAKKVSGPLPAHILHSVKQVASAFVHASTKEDLREPIEGLIRSSRPPKV